MTWMTDEIKKNNHLVRTAKVGIKIQIKKGKLNLHLLYSYECRVFHLLSLEDETRFRENCTNHRVSLQPK